MDGIQHCKVRPSAKGIVEECIPCTRRVICLAERRVERRAARKTGGFLAEVKARLAANEERAAQNERQR